MIVSWVLRSADNGGQASRLIAFTRAGGKESNYIAHWQADPSVPVESKRWGNIKNIYRDE